MNDDSKSYNQPADKMHLISTEDIQYQPLISIRQLHVLDRDTGDRLRDLS